MIMKSLDKILDDLFLQDVKKYSKYFKCSGCNKNPTNLEDMRFIRQYSFCLGCLEHMGDK